MGICKYCGKEAGFFKNKHAECEKIHNINIRAKKAIAEIESIGMAAVAEIESMGEAKAGFYTPPETPMTTGKFLKKPQADFTVSERERLNAVYQEKRVQHVQFYGNGLNGKPSGTMNYSIIRGKDSLEEQLLHADNPAASLAELLGELDYVTDFPLCEKIFNLIDCDNSLKNNRWFWHFHYIVRINIYYRNRNEVEGAFDKAVAACNKMIEIAENLSHGNNKKRIQDNPSHPGYKQLVIILFKQGKYKEVINLCEQAKSQYWKGDWDDRIQKANKKLEKQRAAK